ncbi:MAG: DMT family transporter [Synergistes sp.]|nr:DMT family transporter [Synergistes sp.]
MNDRLKLYAVPLITVILWGITFAAIKIAVRETTPLMVMTFRFVLGAIFIGIYGKMRGEVRMPTKKEAMVLALIGFMAFYFHMGIQTIALKTAGSATSNLQIAASPAAATVLAVIFLKEKITAKSIIGIVISSIGLVVTLLFGTKGAQGISSYTFGDFLMTISIFNWAAYNVISRYFLKDNKFTPVFSLFWELVFASFLCLPTMLVLNQDLTHLVTLSASAWLAILYLAFISTFVCYALWLMTIQKLTVAEIMVFQFIQPLVGIFAGYFMVGERFTIWLAVGTVLIISGVCAVNTGKGKK